MDISSRVLHELSLLWQCQSFNADSQGLTNPRLAPGCPRDFSLTKNSSFCLEGKGYVNVVPDVCMHLVLYTENMAHEGTTLLVHWRTDLFLIKKKKIG